MNRFALTGAVVIGPGAARDRGSLVIEDGRIVEVSARAPHDCPEMDLGGGFLIPGFIDIQVNGGDGVLFNDDPSVDTVAAIAAAHRRFGTTALMPTLISDTPEKIAAGIDAVDKAIESGVPGVVGIHIEGPYLNPARPGIHDPAKIVEISEASLDLLTRPGRGKRLVTLAPELAPEGAIARLRKAGVIVCAGHSAATYEQTRAALDAGLDGFTHLFNAMTQLSARAPGMVGAALDDRRSRFGLIVDGRHVHPAVMRIAIAARGLDGVMLVTDAMPPVGTAMTGFLLGSREIEVRDGMLLGPGEVLAGSNLDAASAFRNAIKLLELDIGQAAQVSSTNAADFLGLAHERGSIAPGLRADLVHLDETLQVQKVWHAGSLVHG